MGNPYKDDVSAMCYNAPKTWQLGWYDSNKETIDPTKGQWSGTIVGVADFDKNPENYPVVVKIETGTGTDQFIAFNRATGVNRHSDDADNEVTIVETSENGEGAAQSYMKAHLAQGDYYIYPDWANTGQNLVIIANTINVNTGNSAGYAEVQVCLGCAVETPDLTQNIIAGLFLSLLLLFLFVHAHVQIERTKVKKDETAKKVKELDFC